MDTVERFNNWVGRGPDECLNWMGAINRDGYGCFSYGSSVNQCHSLAHRMAWQLVHGPLPSYKETKLQIDHWCSNRKCCNVDHMSVVTPRENQRRSPMTFTNKNLGKTHCHRGHEYDEANTRISVHGKRACRKCDAINCNARYSRRKDKS